MKKILLILLLPLVALAQPHSGPYPQPGGSSTTTITNNAIPTIGNVSFLSNGVAFSATSGDTADATLFNAGISNSIIQLGAGVFNKTNTWHNNVVGMGPLATSINDYTLGGLNTSPAFQASSTGASNYSGFSWHTMVPQANATNVSVWGASDSALTNFIKDVWVSVGDTNEAIDGGYFPSVGLVYATGLRVQGCWDDWFQQAGRFEFYNSEFITDASSPISGGLADNLNLPDSGSISGLLSNCKFTRYGTFATNGFCIIHTITTRCKNLTIQNCIFSNAPVSGTGTNIVWGGTTASLNIQGNINLPLSSINYGTTPTTSIIYQSGQDTNRVRWSAGLNLTNLPVQITNTTVQGALCHIPIAFMTGPGKMTVTNVTAGLLLAQIQDTGGWTNNLGPFTLNPNDRLIVNVESGTGGITTNFWEISN
jgi:hypothetical protein